MTEKVETQADSTPTPTERHRALAEMSNPHLVAQLAAAREEEAATRANSDDAASSQNSEPLHQVQERIATLDRALTPAAAQVSTGWGSTASMTGQHGALGPVVTE